MPTITQRVRSFLAHEGVRLRPWSGLAETYGELYGLLEQRRSDPHFWGPLRDLLREVIADATDPSRKHALAAPKAELLASWDVDTLVEKLRAALPEAAGRESSAPARDSSTLHRYTSQLSVAVLGGFLLLGLAATGCSDDSDSKAEPTPEEQEWAVGCGLDSSSVLFTTIGNSNLTLEQKRQLCGCLAEVNQSWSDGLTSLFETRSPEEIASVLEEILRCDSQMQSQLRQEYSQSVEQELLSETLCQSVPLYKGVSFAS